MDLGSFPTCEQLIFLCEIKAWSGYERLENGPWCRNIFFDTRDSWGEGIVEPTHEAECGTNYFKEGWNYFNVEVGPLCPGNYVMRLYTFSWAMDIKIGENCEALDPELGPFEYWQGKSLQVVAENLIHVPFTCLDPLRLNDIVAIDDGSEDPEAYFDTIYPGDALTMNHKYWLVTHLRTNMFEETLPNYLNG